MRTVAVILTCLLAIIVVIDAKPKPEPRPKLPCLSFAYGSATINVDQNELTLQWDNLRPDSKGKIDQTTIPNTGSINWGDADLKGKSSVFNYYPVEGKIYWDGEKNPKKAWSNVKCTKWADPSPCKLLESEGRTITINDDFTLSLTMDDGPEAEFKGKMDYLQPGQLSLIGTVTFDQLKIYSFTFYPKEKKIYWGGSMTKYSNLDTWSNVECIA